MNINPISFSLAEKLAIVNALDHLILADGTVHDGEMKNLSGLMKSLDFDSNFMIQARNVSKEQGSIILKGMPANKKKALATFLAEMAIADGFVHQKEADLINDILTTIEEHSTQNLMEFLSASEAVVEQKHTY